jgi:RimJ/RimL family protein N-acetyltransferase
MRHAISIDGFAHRLRPVADADAGLIVSLRTDERLARFLHRTSTDPAEQLRWLARYYERADDYYFAIERRPDGPAEGFVGIYDVDTSQRRAEWGRWILRPGSLAAVESAWLVYQVAFEILGLESVYCRTIVENAPVVSFHDSCGIHQRRVLPAHVELGGRRLDVVEHSLRRAEWETISPRLARLSERTARRLSHD